MTHDEIIARLQERAAWQRIRRYGYTKRTTLPDALATIETIGRYRSALFRLDDDNRFAYENFAKWCYGDTTMACLNAATRQPQRGDLQRGIFIAGGTGTGKTWCMDILNAYCDVEGYEVLLPGRTQRTPLRWTTVRADALCALFLRTGLISDSKRRPLLCIQDLGSEPATTLYMGNRVEVLRSLLECRGDDMGTLTLITSNCRPTDRDFAARYGDRVVSRLCEMCNYLEIRGSDRRQRATGQ